MSSSRTPTPANEFTRRLDEGGDLPNRALVGGKAWSLARMGNLGLRVPPAFVVTTDGFRAYHRDGRVPAVMADEILAGVAGLEQATGRRFGRGPHPLLLSVRSGAAVSMPGMMDTVLNLGMTDEVETALANESQNGTFARDTHMRFLDLFLDVVLGLDPRDHRVGDEPQVVRDSVDRALGALQWSPVDQLMAAVDAVFRSWNSRRARRYRTHQGISDDLGTAVTVQAMVFGNLGDDSGTGVLFSRNPLTGERTVYGEYLRRAQGEDVVSGRVTPRPLSDLETQLPALHTELLKAAETLERANREVQDVEFTVQRGSLYLLQSRTAKLAPDAAVRTSVDMVAEGLMSVEAALARVSPAQARAVVAPHLTTSARTEATLARGHSACAGVGAGLVVSDPEEAVRRAAEGQAIVLARPTTSPDDLAGMIAARAVITEEGGSTSHAAVVGRALGLPCVVGCGTGALAGLKGETVTVDGGEGAVYAGELPMDVPREDDSPVLSALVAWSRGLAPLDVSVSADGIEPAEVLDLTTLTGGSDPELVGDVIRAHPGHRVLIGGASTAPEAVAAAIETGVTRIVADPVLPVLLTAVHLALTQRHTLDARTPIEGPAR